jgi:hypothetical protein
MTADRGGEMGNGVKHKAGNSIDRDVETVEIVENSRWYWNHLKRKCPWTIDGIVFRALSAAKGRGEENRKGLAW